MNLLDRIAGWIHDLLGILPPEAVDFLWFPVVVVVVFVAVMLVVRRLMPVVGRLAATLLQMLTAFVGAVLLVPDMAIATAYRSAHRQPPAVLYHYGDAVATSMIGVTRTSGAVSHGFARVAKAPVIVVMLVCAALIGGWNQGYCPPEPATQCVRPFTGWIDRFGDDEPVAPDPGGSTGPSAPPVAR